MSVDRSRWQVPWSTVAVRAGLVLVGGALGTAARAAAESAAPPAPDGVPWATLLVNLVGSFALGALVGLLGDPPAGRRHGARLLLGTGVLGGFTTYSTFVVEIVTRASDGAVALAVGYALVSVLIGVAAAALGILAARAIRPARWVR